MAAVIDSTWGSTSANSYCTVEESNIYHAARLHTSSWLDSVQVPDTTKIPALIWATSLIDQLFEFDGSKVSSIQALSCPRIGVLDREYWPVDMITKPNWVYQATAEYAYWLVQDDLMASMSSTDQTDGSADMSGFKQITVGTITLKSSIGSSLQQSSASAMPYSVFSILRPYGKYVSSGQRRLIR